MDEQSAFIAALERPDPSERSTFLQEACRDNPELRERIEKLLEVHQRAADFLETPAVPTRSSLDKISKTLGDYRIIGEIGRGGMGVVYEAEQISLERRVALKVIKPGMDSKQVITRFEAERQALALMDHPNIARVLDAGSTDSGQPYFVMDLVKGIPITEYCDRERLTTRERLELFVQVCQAVQHAHQKGVIHRDIKPTNVMVTLHDGTPIPKIIDFGVAKATSGQLTDQSVVTGLAQVIGTPLYMSPEQAELGGPDVDTRTDIYSLGVLLYELLTGTTPFEQKKLSELSYDEMRRIIREEEPPKPSTRISTLGDSLDTVAENRNADRRTLTRQVSGELDWIVMRAVEKDHTRRYETVNSFAQDVRRYLNDEPVEACPPSAAYRFRKFARRNRTLLTSFFMVLLVLVAGMAISLWQATIARNALGVAEDHRIVAEEKSRLAEEVVDQFYVQFADKWARQEPRQTQVQREFLEAAVAFYEQMVKERRTDEDAQFKTAVAYHRIANLYGHQMVEREKAEPAYRKAIEILEELTATSTENCAVFELLVNTKIDYGFTLLETRKAEAENEFREALALLDPVPQSFPKYPDYLHLRARAYEHLGLVLMLTGRKIEAESAYNRAIETLDSLLSNDPADIQVRCSLAFAHHDLGGLQTLAAEASERHLQTAIDLLDEVVRRVPHDPRLRRFLARPLQWKGDLLRDNGRIAEAQECYHNAFNLRLVLAKNHPQVFIYQRELKHSTEALVDLCRRTGDLEQAEKLLTEAEAALQMSPDSLNGLYNRADFHAENCDPQKAVDDYSKCLGLMDSPRDRGAVYLKRGGCYWDLAQMDNATRDFEKAVELTPESRTYSSLALVLVSFPDSDLWDPERALSLASKSVELHDQFFFPWLALGAAQFRNGDLDAAEESLERSYSLLRDDPGPILFLAMVHCQRGDADAARRYYDRGVQRMEEKKLSRYMNRWIPYRDEAAEMLGISEADREELREEEKTDQTTPDESGTTGVEAAGPPTG